MKIYDEIRPNEYQLIGERKALKIGNLTVVRYQGRLWMGKQVAGIGWTLTRPLNG